MALTYEKKKTNELPKTGEQKTTVLIVLGVALGLVGLSLVAKRKKQYKKKNHFLKYDQEVLPR